MPGWRPGTVRDPVHGYVSFTGLERLVIDHPIAQRLRYVSQNGLAHLVFPEVRTSRFSHSLGTMHLASRLFITAIDNAESNVRSELLGQIDQEVREVAGPIGRATIDAAIDRLKTDPLLARSVRSDDLTSTLIIAEQSLRLAALFHDLGHLPYSHDFEFALENYHRRLRPSQRRKLDPLFEDRPGLVQIHEKLGHGLATLLFRDLFSGMSKDRTGSETARVCFEFAKRVLDSVPDSRERARKPTDAVEWLHTLIDGELDADRCDYIMRDGRAFGLDFASYDLDRLADNVDVVRSEREGYSTAVLGQGLNTVESFILARHRFYQVGVRHHKVSQVGAALQHCIAEVLLQSQEPTVRQFVEDLVRIDDAEDLEEEQRPALLRRFVSYDDNWWFGVMRAHGGDNSDPWFELVLRRKQGPRSLWKRLNQFPRDVASFNERLPNRDDLLAQSEWYQRVEGLRREGILVARHLFSPWRADPTTGESRLCIIGEDGNPTPVSKWSALISSLPDAWKNDVQIHVFSRGRLRRSREEILNRLMPEGGINEAG